ncbi:MAG TPA: branched chain amino acid aminotransferase, partial [Candidatus Angelobacter sp.]|nr:branched chain amino acid aminotransferase [Candidatus Angelobacter sp.]
MTHSIQFVKRDVLKEKPASSELGFGRFFCDYMFEMDYDSDHGWYDPRIVPYQPITLDPSSMVFHYGQAIFEGLKAYKTREGRIQLFRPTKNMARF